MNIYRKAKQYRYKLLVHRHLFSLLPRKEALALVSASGENQHQLITLHPKNLKHKIQVRKNFIDKSVLSYVLHYQYHLPPRKLGISPVIVDLGTNIGLTVAHMKTLYPAAKIYGCEMDKENYKLAVANTNSYPDVNITNGAIWIKNEKLTYNKAEDNDAYSLKDNRASGKMEEVQAMTISTFLKKHELEHVDYMKIDIEGVEKDILVQDDLDWLQKIEMLNLELHLSKSDPELEFYIDILKRNGFDAYKDSNHFSGILAVRKS